MTYLELKASPQKAAIGDVTGIVDIYGHCVYFLSNNSSLNGDGCVPLKVKHGLKYSWNCGMFFDHTANNEVNLIPDVKFLGKLTGDKNTLEFKSVKKFNL